MADRVTKIEGFELDLETLELTLGPGEFDPSYKPTGAWIIEYEHGIFAVIYPDDSFEVFRKH